MLIKISGQVKDSSSLTQRKDIRKYDQESMTTPGLRIDELEQSEPPDEEKKEA